MALVIEKRPETGTKIRNQAYGPCKKPLNPSIRVGVPATKQNKFGRCPVWASLDWRKRRMMLHRPRGDGEARRVPPPPTIQAYGLTKGRYDKAVGWKRVTESASGIFFPWHDPPRFRPQL